MEFKALPLWGKALLIVCLGFLLYYGIFLASMMPDQLFETQHYKSGMFSLITTMFFGTFMISAIRRRSWFGAFFAFCLVVNSISRLIRLRFDIAPTFFRWVSVISFGMAILLTFVELLRLLLKQLWKWLR